jgi:hypothetical protein
MSPRIELVSTSAQFAIEGDTRQTFTPDHNVNDIPLDALVPGQGLLKDSSGNTWLHPKDNFNILSLGVSMPYHFAMSNNMPVRIQLYWQDSTNVYGTFNIGSAGYFWLPFEGYEVSIGTYVPWPVAANGSIRLFLVLDTTVPNFETRVSMIGAPSTLDGLTLAIAAWCKVSINDKFYFVP